MINIKLIEAEFLQAKWKADEAADLAIKAEEAAKEANEIADKAFTLVATLEAKLISEIEAASSSPLSVPRTEKIEALEEALVQATMGAREANFLAEEAEKAAREATYAADSAVRKEYESPSSYAAHPSYFENEKNAKEDAKRKRAIANEKASLVAAIEAELQSEIEACSSVAVSQTENIQSLKVALAQAKLEADEADALEKEAKKLAREATLDCDIRAEKEDESPFSYSMPTSFVAAERKALENLKVQQQIAQNKRQTVVELEMKLQSALHDS